MNREEHETIRDLIGNILGRYAENDDHRDLTEEGLKLYKNIAQAIDEMVAKLDTEVKTRHYH